MLLETKKYLSEIQQATERLMRFTKNRTMKDYSNDDLLRAGVERQFEIIGEALNRIAKYDPGTLSRITDYKRIIAFRNILIHGYDIIDNQVVWDVIQNNLPTLRREIENLLKER